LFGLLIATFTAALLLINGWLVWLAVKTAARSGSPMLARPDVAQLLLFSVPLVMVVVEWKVIDYVCQKFRRHPS
jgi:hypothetical protein